MQGICITDHIITGCNIEEKFLESKFKEYDAMARMAKVTAEIGLITAPPSIKDEAVSEFMSTFKREIEEIIRKTF